MGEQIGSKLAALFNFAQFPLAQIGLWTRQVTDKIKACVVADYPGSFSLRLSPDPQGRLLSRQPLTAAVRDRRLLRPSVR